jgi:hypothetical protein
MKTCKWKPVPNTSCIFLNKYAISISNKHISYHIGRGKNGMPLLLPPNLLHGSTTLSTNDGAKI